MTPDQILEHCRDLSHGINSCIDLAVNGVSCNVRSGYIHQFHKSPVGFGLSLPDIEYGAAQPLLLQCHPECNAVNHLAA